MKNFSLKLTVVVIFLICCYGVSAQHLPSWSFKKKLTLNTTDAGISQAQTDFPLLVRVSGADFIFTEAEGTGQDLRFTLDDGTELGYEIELWDFLNEVGVLWVNVPTIAANDGNQFIWMYWGNSQAPVVENGALTFAAAHDFDGVYHLGEESGTNSEDATGVNDGTHSVGANSAVGMIGNAQNFTGTGNYITLANEANFDYTSTVSVSAWIKVNAFTVQWQAIVTKAEGAWRLHRNSTTNTLNFATEGSSILSLDGVADVSGGGWFHVVAVLDGANRYLYLNGAEDASESNLTGTINPTNKLVTIGQNLDNPNRIWDGLIDEVRISGQVRSADWIKLSYETQKATAAVVEFGDKESNLPENPPPILGFSADHMLPVTRVTQEADGLGGVRVQFRVKDPNSTDATLDDIGYSNNGTVWTSLSGSQALSTDWQSRVYPSAPDFNGTIHSLTIETAQVLDLAGNLHPTFQIRMRATNGTVGEYLVTSPMSLDNELPGVTVTGQATPVRSPRISGTSTEQLSLVQVNVDGNNYLGSVLNSSSFEVPAGLIAPLPNGDYSISVTATDMFGYSTSQIFLDILTINGSATEVNVDVLYTRETSPEITGTVGDNNAVVMVEIGGESFEAAVAGGVWTVPAGTFQNLTEGTHDVNATADLDGEVGQDGTSGELTIDTYMPIAQTSNIYSNAQNPVIEGIVNEHDTRVTVTINDITVDAVVDRSDWVVEGNAFEGLPEGTYTIILQASDSAGNVGIDSTSDLIIDRTLPLIASFTPRLIKTTRLPELRMTFNEEVRSGTGTLSVVLTSNDSTHGLIQASTASGKFTKTLTFSLTDSLLASSDYHVLVAADAIIDLAGNPYTGILSDSSWVFSTADADAPFIKLVTSSLATGVYPIGTEIDLTLNFTDSVTLVGGNLNATLDIGVIDTTLVIAPFASTSEVSFSYTVKFGDFTTALDIISLTLDSGATLVNNAGGDVILDIGQDQNLSFTKTIGLDGIPLVLNVTKPGDGPNEANALVTYNINKGLTSGNVNWKQVDASGSIPAADLIDVSIPFSADMLSAGLHENINLNPLIERGAVYDVTITVVDSAGTNIVVKKPGIKIGEKVTSIRITPLVYEYKLGEVVQLVVFDVLNNEPISEGVSWSLIGEGELDSAGTFTATSLGQVKIAAVVGLITDTLTLRVAGGGISIAMGSVDIITAADNFTLQLGIPLAENKVLSFSAVVDSQTTAFNRVGPAIAFEPFVVEFATLQFKVDSLLLDTTGGKSFAVYRQVDVPGLEWELVPSEVKGEWIIFTVVASRLGTYMLAQIKDPPVITPGIIPVPVEGQNLRVPYTGSSNIQNPGLTLTYTPGGGGDVVLPVNFSMGDTLAADIPGSAVTPHGLVYRFEITDGTHRVQSGYLEVNVTNLNDIPITTSLAKGIYQSFTLPMTHESPLVEAVLMDEWGEEDKAEWRLYRYDMGFVELNAGSGIETGEAYWLNMKNKQPTITIEAGSGTSVPLATGVKLKLNEGWNTFGNPYLFDISYNHFVNVNGSGPLFVYAYPRAGEYSPLDVNSSIQPWQGYIVWNGAPGAPLMDSLQLKAVAPDVVLKKTAGKTGTHIKLFLKGETSVNGELSLSFNSPGALQGRDPGDLPKPLSPSKRVSLGLKVPWSEVDYLRDSRGDLGEGQSWNLQARAVKKGESLTLALRDVHNIPGTYSAALFNHTNGDVQMLKKSPVNEYGFRATGVPVHKLEVIVGTDDYVKEKLNSFQVPITNIGLHQNFPNPFTGVTRITYQVPGTLSGPAKSVRLDVYNLKGEVVKTLVNSFQSAGNYTVSWQGIGIQQSRLPSGTYFYRLKVSNEVLQKKLVLLR